MVEILITAFIIVGALLVAVAVTDRSIVISRQATQVAQASFLLEEGAEAMRILRDNDWDNIDSVALSISATYYIDFTGGTWALATIVSPVGIFTRTVTVGDVYRDANDDIATSGTLDSQTRLINIEVAWSNGAKALNKKLSFYLSDIFSTND